MDCDEMEALRVLASFAEDHAEEVYGDSEEEYPGCTENVATLMEAVKIAYTYLDGDQNDSKKCPECGEAIDEEYQCCKNNACDFFA